MLFDMTTLKASIVLLVMQDHFGEIAARPSVYRNGREVGYSLISRCVPTSSMRSQVAIVEDRSSDLIKVVSGSWKGFDISSGIANDKANVRYFDSNEYLQAASFVHELLTVKPAEL